MRHFTLPAKLSPVVFGFFWRQSVTVPYIILSPASYPSIVLYIINIIPIKKRCLTYKAPFCWTAILVRIPCRELMSPSTFACSSGQRCHEILVSPRLQGWALGSLKTWDVLSCENGWNIDEWTEEWAELQFFSWNSEVQTFSCQRMNWRVHVVFEFWKSTTS